MLGCLIIQKALTEKTQFPIRDLGFISIRFASVLFQVLLRVFSLVALESLLSRPSVVVFSDKSLITRVTLEICAIYQRVSLGKNKFQWVCTSVYSFD